MTNMRMHRHHMAIACAMAVLTANLTAWCQETTAPWWEDFPRIVSTNNLTTALEHHATVAFFSNHNDPGWGTYGQIVGENPSMETAFSEAGLKTISYYETYGQSYCYLAEVGPWDEVNITPRRAIHWNWQIYAGGERRWIGVQNFFDNEEFARPYTRIHPRYGGSALTYPDGTMATGYFSDDPTDPRNSRVFDACISKDLWGNKGMEYYFNATINAIDPDTGQPAGPLDGTLEVDGKYCSLIMFQKDAACPGWHDYTYASTLMGADSGLDGMWTDNWGGWDSFGRPPLTKSFGDWSVARFRDYLTANFTPAEWQELGVQNVNTFDVRTAMREKAIAWGGHGNNVSDSRWRDARWLDDPLWHAYLIYKRQVGTEALDTYYATVKAAAAAAGKDEFFVAGNDVGAYSFGWVRGELDMASYEVSAGWGLSTGPRGFMLPPKGRLAPRYKLAREHTKSRFTNVWLYRDGFDEYLGNPNITSLMYYEMLATHTLPMFHPDNARVAGTAQNNAAFFAFVEQAAPTFGARLPVEDVGILYSTSSLLTFMTPYDFYRHNAQPHQFGIYGWATALGELHYQYRFVPEWKVTTEELAGLRVLIIANADVLEPALVDDVIAPWVAAGGRLIVTGDSGVRLGEEGNFRINPNGSSLAELTGSAGPDNVWYESDNLGMEYYVQDGQRTALLADLRTSLDSFLADASPLVIAETDTVPSTIGLTVYEDEEARRFFIDANNFNIDLDTDTVQPTSSITFDVAIPAWMGSPELLTTVSPDGGIAAQLGPVQDGRVTVTIAPFTFYVSVVIEDGDPIPVPHSADLDSDFTIDTSEFLRVIQLYNSRYYHCDAATTDGYASGFGVQDCPPHDSDYAAQDWEIRLPEVLRLVQFANAGGYHPCEDGEDLYCPGATKRYQSTMEAKSR